jgi:hypothetical protein
VRAPTPDWYLSEITISGSHPAAPALLDRLDAAPALPQLGLVRRRANPPRVDDIDAVARAEVRRVLAAAPGPPGPVAVGVGSRGIANLAAIVGAVVGELRAACYEPFIVPAMGSHGGGTPEGQLEVLAGYGISERALGVPVRATMETTVIGELDGLPVPIDRFVVEADRAFLVCRVKPHTDFRGPIGSGAAKMAAIGMGKQVGAAALHALGVPGLRDRMPAVGRFVAEKLLLGALGIVENEFDETQSLSGLLPADVAGPREAELLEQARASLPSLPFEPIDVLVVERIGKDVSGTGMDPNVTGRWLIAGLEEPDPPPVRCIVALSLTEASHGNALGVGLADFVTQRLADAIDPDVTYTNGLTAGWMGLARLRLPVVLPTDRDAITVAASASGRRPDEPLRLVWIQDTLHTRVVAASSALCEEVDGDLEVLGDLFDVPLDAAGALQPLAQLARGE